MGAAIRFVQLGDGRKHFAELWLLRKRESDAPSVSAIDSGIRSSFTHWEKVDEGNAQGAWASFALWNSLTLVLSLRERKSRASFEIRVPSRRLGL